MAGFTGSGQFNYVFQKGERGYLCFRIPAIVSTIQGTLLAFAEARRNGCSDTDDIDLVMKRSSDNGETWSSLKVIWDNGSNTCGNPSPVVDQVTGKILLLSTWNSGADHEQQIIDGTSKDTRRVFVFHSSDDGLNWSAPREITRSVKQPDWTWYATGPVNGIQLHQAPHKGRIVIPCDHIEAGTKKYYSHVIFSDDTGETWQLGGTTPSDGVNESTVAELPDGRLLLNMRNYTGARIRQVSISTDGGSSWSKPQGDSSLPEPVCQASLLSMDDSRGGSLLAFSNPADPKNRVRMTVRISSDGGITWPYQKILHEGPSAYSNLVLLANGKLACLFEAGVQSAYEGIAFTAIPLEELLHR